MTSGRTKKRSRISRVPGAGSRARSGAAGVAAASGKCGFAVVRSRCAISESTGASPSGARTIVAVVARVVLMFFARGARGDEGNARVGRGSPLDGARREMATTTRRPFAAKTRHSRPLTTSHFPRRSLSRQKMTQEQTVDVPHLTSPFPHTRVSSFEPAPSPRVGSARGGLPNQAACAPRVGQRSRRPRTGRLSHRHSRDVLLPRASPRAGVPASVERGPDQVRAAEVRRAGAPALANQGPPRRGRERGPGRHHRSPPQQGRPVRSMERRKTPRGTPVGALRPRFAPPATQPATPRCC